MVAQQFIPWLAVAPGSRWLDIGCGSGTLIAEILRSQAPDEVWGADPEENFLAFARSRCTDPRCHIIKADAQSLPLDLTGFDATVSGLALNLIPDPARALSEMARATRVDRVVGVYVWDFAERMQLFRALWDAAVELDPAAAELDHGRRYGLCRPDRLQSLFEGAGLQQIEHASFDVKLAFRDFDDYWQPLLNGGGHATGYVMSLDARHRDALRDRIRAKLQPGNAGSIHLEARAWAVRGTPGTD